MILEGKKHEILVYFFQNHGLNVFSLQNHVFKGIIKHPYHKCDFLLKIWFFLSHFNHKRKHWFGIAVEVEISFY
jgi:hypothetical protein